MTSQSVIEVSNEIRGINRDQAEAKLRRLAQIDRRLELQPLSIQERFELCEERSAILAPWLD